VKLLFSPTFIRTSKRLIKRNAHLKMTVQATLKALESDLFNPNLRTHKLKGRFEGYWSCSVTYDIRIVFKIVKDENEDAILLQTIGTHDEVY
jgi:addiction module RelE/StbE family toxin